MRMLIAIALAAAQDLEHTKDALDDVKARLEKKEAVLIDVREPKEWDDGHLLQATLVPLSWLREESGKGTAKETIAGRIPAMTIVYAHCRAGSRSLTAAQLLKQLGYDVRPLKPGYEELKKAGFPEAPLKK